MNPYKKQIRTLYLFIYSLMSILLLGLLYSYIKNSFLENDLLWFIPGLLRSTQGKSAYELIYYLLSPKPIWFVITLKTYAFPVLYLFGAFAKYFISISIIFHFVNSTLLYLVSRRLGLNIRISFFSSLMYLTLFAHFHAYLWPMAFQHLLIIFFFLCGLFLYLETDRRRQELRRYRSLFILTLLINFAASFCRVSILILPISILAHILLSSRDLNQRLNRYNFWMPLFCIYLIWPLIFLIVGDVALQGLSRPINLLFQNYGLGGIWSGKFSSPLKFLLFFSLGLSFLFIFKKMLVVFNRHAKFFKISLIIFFAVLAVVLFIIGGPKRLLVPFNMIAPFTGILASFLEPLSNSLLIDSSLPYHFIPLQVNAFYLLLSLLILGIFILKFAIKDKQLFTLFIFYAADLIYLYLWNPLTSRYFIYLSGIFCIIFCSAADYLYSSLTNPLKISSRAKEVIFSLIFVALCIPNLLAIRLSLFRGQLINTFLTYNYARSADAIRNNIIDNPLFVSANKQVYVKGISVIGFPYSEDLPAIDRYNDNLRFIFQRAFNDRSIDILSEPPPEGSKLFSYSIEGDRVFDREGRDIVRFNQFYEKAIENIKNNPEESLQLFIKALEERPYLLRYLISNLELQDLRWITGCNDLRTWINNVTCYNSGTYLMTNAEIQMAKAIYKVMNKEIDRYIQCLYFISFLKNQSGNTQESKYYFSQIRFLESDYSRLYSWLSKEPLLKSDKEILSFLDSFDNKSLYVRHENYTDRFCFERFLFRLIFKETQKI